MLFSNTEKCYLNSKDNYGFYFDGAESHWSGECGDTYKFNDNRMPGDNLFSNDVLSESELIV